MKQLAFSQYSEITLTIIGLIIFFGYFIIMFIKTIAMNKSSLNYLANLPLENEIEAKNGSK